MRGACRLRQFWRFNLILTHCGFLGRASAKQSEISENSENSEHSDGLADARTMVCRSWLTAYPPWRRWGVVWSGTACHRLRGGNYICVLGAPGMSPIPRSAQYPATHSCHRLRGGVNVRLWSSSAPAVAALSTSCRRSLQVARFCEPYPFNPFNPCSCYAARWYHSKSGAASR